MFGNLINGAMTQVDKLSGLAKNMISKDIQVYDASTSTITIGGVEVTGWETATISDAELTKEYAGTHQYEVAFVKQVYARKLTISILPTEEINKQLAILSGFCMSWNKYTKISITDNGVWHGDYNAQFASGNGLNMQQEAENRTWEFHIIPISTATTENARFTETAVAIEVSPEVAIPPTPPLAPPTPQ